MMPAQQSLEARADVLLYSFRQARQDGSCNPDGGSPSSYSALPMRHWHALHCAKLTPVAPDDVDSLNLMSATGVVWRRVERPSPHGPSMTIPPCLSPSLRPQPGARQ